MKSIIASLSLFILSFVSYSQQKNGYQYTIDLTKVVDDKVYVELTPPTLSQSEITFYFPKMIPGTYAIEDYGRFVSDLTVVDKKGKKLAVNRIDDNSWKIKDANKMAKLSYWIEDSFDTKLKGPQVFQPAGTNIEENKNFIINSSGFLGYFDNQKETAFTLTVIRPENFYGSTGMIAQKTGVPLSKLSKEISGDASGKLVDVFTVENYDRLVDSPLMYCKPDTAIVYVGNTEVLIGSYSPTQKITAKQIAANVREVLLAQMAYLGGKLPVNKYAFIFYFTDQPVYSYGALEHSYSSFYFMPEATIENMGQQLRDFAAHEFFHIVTPLTIHSEEIGTFGFNNPKMSRHLWLYEGLTEYFAGNVQVKYGLISPEEYLQILQEKMLTADGFKDDLPFTELSLGALDKHADQYYNVYQKGTLISMCLDIQLRKLSNGKYGMQNLVAELGSRYGTNKSFKDDELFAEITAITYPQIGEFLAKHVAGSASLPLPEIFKLVGVTYEEEVVTSEYTLGLEQQAIGVVQYEGKAKLAIGNADAINDQGRALGFKTGDILLKINGEEIPDLGPVVGDFIQKQQQSLGEGKTLSYTVARKEEVIELKAVCQKAERKKRHKLEFDPAASYEQIALRDAWIKP